MNAIFGRTRLVTAIAGALLVAACGGGGGNAGTPPIPAPATPTPATPPPTGPTVSIPIDGLTPTSIAFQSGTSGAWTPVTPSGGKIKFTLPVGATSYSVAAMCPMNGSPVRRGPAEVIVQATTSDSPSMYCVGSVPGTVNASVLVQTSAFPNANLSAVQYVSSYPWSGPGFYSPTGGVSIGAPLWAAGPSDLVLQISNSNGLQAARIERNVTLTPNEALTLTPMTQSDAVTATPVQVPAGTNTTGLSWVTAEGYLVLLGFAPGSPSMPIIPAASALPGDYYEAFAVNTGAQYAFEATSAPAASSLSFPAFPAAPFTIPTVTPADLPSANLAFNGFTISGTRYYSMVLSYVSPGAPVPAGAPLVTLVASQNYLGTSTTVTMPDLSSIAGMLPAPKAQSVNLIGNDYVATGAMPWDNMEVGNAFAIAPLPVSTQFQVLQSQGNLTFTAP